MAIGAPRIEGDVFAANDLAAWQEATQHAADVGEGGGLDLGEVDSVAHGAFLEISSSAAGTCLFQLRGVYNPGCANNDLK
jgi:hypothetical protein